MSYKPRTPPKTSLAALAVWLGQELRLLATALDRPPVLQERHTPPDKLIPGMIVWADGTDWNPGAGRGIYWYDGTNWNKLG